MWRCNIVWHNKSGRLRACGVGEAAPDIWLSGGGAKSALHAPPLLQPPIVPLHHLEASSTRNLDKQDIRGHQIKARNSGLRPPGRSQCRACRACAGPVRHPSSKRQNSRSVRGCVAVIEPSEFDKARMTRQGNLGLKKTLGKGAHHGVRQAGPLVLAVQCLNGVHRRLVVPERCQAAPLRVMSSAIRIWQCVAVQMSCSVAPPGAASVSTHFVAETRVSS